MNKTKYLLLIVFGVLLVSAAAVASAQPDLCGITIYGTVDDEDGNPVNDATVSLYIADSFVKSTLSDADGNYLIEYTANTSVNGSTWKVVATLGSKTASKSGTITCPTLERVDLRISFFFDDFESGDLDEWQIVAGNWTIISETGNKVLKGWGTQDTHHGLALKQTTSLDIEMRAKIKNPHPQHDGEPSEVDAGLFWGDLSLVGSAYKRIPGYAMNVDHGKLVLRVVYSNGSETWLNTKNVSLESNKYYTYKFRIYKNGTLVGKIFDGNTELFGISAKETTYISAEKHLGLFADFDGEPGYWDDIGVYSIEGALELPDLTLLPADILVSNLNPYIGEVVKVTAVIRNIGETAADNFEVGFWDGDPFGAESVYIGNVTVDRVEAGATKTTEIYWRWTVKPGTHLIYVLPDKDNSVEESDEANNIQSKSIEVSCAYDNINKLHAPGTEKALILAPYHHQGAVGYSEDLKKKLESSGWQVDYYKDKEVDITNLDEWLDEDYGIIHLMSHGTTNDVAIEYFNTEEQRDARWAELKLVYKEYGLIHVLDMFSFGKDEKDDKPYIGIKGDFIRARCENLLQHPLVYVEACYMGVNEDMKDAFVCKGAGAYVGFDDHVLVCAYGYGSVLCPERTVGEATRDFYKHFVDNHYTVKTACEETPPADTTGLNTPYADLVSYGNDKNLVFEIPKESSIITISASPGTINLPESVRISGDIIPAHSAIVTLTFTSPTGIALEQPTLSTISGAYHFVFPPNEEGIWLVNATWPGDSDTPGNTSETVSFTVNESKINVGYAIIITGRQDDNFSQEYIDLTANEVYKILIERSFTHERIFYLNPSMEQDTDGDDIYDVDRISSLTNVSYAINTWAQGNASVDEPLLVYMVDHGGNNTFLVNGVANILTASDLNNHLDNLTDATGCYEITVFYEACHSGSFIDELSRAGRAIVTSTNLSSYSFIDQDGGFFSVPFFNSIRAGQSIKKAFEDASNAVDHKSCGLQEPWLDDDGNGVGHPIPLEGTGDGSIAEDRYIGVRRGHLDFPPTITGAIQSQEVVVNSTVTIWTTVVDDSTIKDVYASIIEPNFSILPTNDTLIEINLTTLYLEDPDGDGNYTTNFTLTELGNYTLILQATDEKGNMASPKQCIITTVSSTESAIFDTGEGTYPSIAGLHNGTLISNQDIIVHKIYTYPCKGTGGHSEYVKIWNSTWKGVEAYWDGYIGDWHNITFNETFVLYKSKTYNYTIKTGSYPQIIHESGKDIWGGRITCTEFTDVNGHSYNNWIATIKLMGV